MRYRRLLAALVAAPAILLAGCSSGDAAPAGASASAAQPLSSPQTQGQVSPQVLEQLRAGYESAYNDLPIDQALSYEEYLPIFEPVWRLATDAGVSLYRRPVQEIDGFTLSAVDATSPGHALFLEATSGASTWCIADTEVLPDALTTPQQRNAAGALPKEFALVDGPCTVLVDDLAERMADAQG